MAYNRADAEWIWQWISCTKMACGSSTEESMKPCGVSFNSMLCLLPEISTYFPPMYIDAKTSMLCIECIHCLVMSGGV